MVEASGLRVIEAKGRGDITAAVVTGAHGGSEPNRGPRRAGWSISKADVTTKQGAMPQLILASTSPWRRRILHDAGLPVRCEAPGVDESTVTSKDPIVLVRELARRKAHAVAERHPSDWTLGADQVAYDTETLEIWGKPPDPAEHLRRLKSMRGRRHTLVTGFALVTPEGTTVKHERSDLWMRADLQDAELERYVATGEGSGCAGGYAAEGLGAFLFERVEGDWFNVLGLPLFRVLGLLRARGWRFGEES